MSYNELPRRELQTMCKKYGLPANKTNAAMASSLRAFLGDPRTDSLARAPQVSASATAKKSNRAKVPLKAEMQETSLAALILAAKPRDLVSHGKLLKKGGDVPDGRNIKADLSAFIVPAPAKIAADSILPKTTPLLRRRRNHDAIPPIHAEERLTFADFAQVDSADTTKNLNEDNLNQASGTVKKLSTPEPQPLPDLNSAAWDTCNDGPTRSNTPHQQEIAVSSPVIQVKGGRQISSNEFKSVASSSARDQGYPTKRCCQNYVKPALSPLFRITANVDKLIYRATAMLEKFQEWKSDIPQGPGTDIAVGS